MNNRVDDKILIEIVSAAIQDLPKTGGMLLTQKGGSSNYSGEGQYHKSN